jgi:osmoprotectant transport system ATP-binding protein
MKEPSMPDTDTLIRLEKVSKTYPGTATPAVADLDLDINVGEILVLVGPSGCGKSTTLRLINRMIEPTGGRIIFEGEDVTDVDPDILRRRIGYVIQQIGLFPHRTIAQNIATVPQLLGWDKGRIDARIDELLEMVGMDPKTYRDRYPKELSGGQAQRVGVARALGADPDVLLMDEPFGAIDPITRDRLQNEFLRLQAELKKTIVFVTHDIDEAIKMGDRIAILKEQSVVAQHDTPESILAHPANPFVEDFLGSGAILKGLTLRRVREMKIPDAVTITMPTERNEVLNIIRASDRQWALLLDPDGRPLRWIDERAVNRSDVALEKAGLPVRVEVEPEDTLQEALEAMLRSSTGVAIVVGPKGAYEGVIRMETLTELIREIQETERARQEAEAG